MKKTFMGVRLRRLREERGLNQLALAQALGLSPSYLNQLEQNQRPLTVAVLLKLNAAFGLDVALFSHDEEARLISELRAALADATGPDTVSLAEIRELAAGMPAVARTLIRLQDRHREALERLETLAGRLGDDRGDHWGEFPGLQRQPYEEVRDFFTLNNNHVAELDEAAERLALELQLVPGQVGEALASRLAQRHGVRLVQAPNDAATGMQRHYDPVTKVLQLSPQLEPGQAAFQMATQLAFLEMQEVLDRLPAQAGVSDGPAHALTRIGLANYFAGALLLPYSAFLQAAETLRYDIDLLGRRFGVGFETICHRLSTLQRPTARGVPFFFIRVDRAGNISKRQSATNFHFSRAGGTCPLWNVYEAFAQPGRILTQLASMPDSRTYLWVARTVASGYQGYGQPGKTFAIALGCDVQHADRLTYATGVNLHQPQAVTPIGMGCKVCERQNCTQRAFPFIGRPVDVNENRRSLTPYSVTAQEAGEPRGGGGHALSSGADLAQTGPLLF